MIFNLIRHIRHTADSGRNPGIQLSYTQFVSIRDKHLSPFIALSHICINLYLSVLSIFKFVPCL